VSIRDFQHIYLRLQIIFNVSVHIKISIAEVTRQEQWRVT